MKRVFTPTKKSTILILDDEAASQAYRHKFQAQGFKTELTSAFDTTLQTLKSAAVDLAILDLCAPGINVIELIRSIRSDDGLSRIPIIVFSNPYLGRLTQAAADAGATKCVEKFDTTPERLLELMRELGITATPKVAGGNAGVIFELNRENSSANLLLNGSQVLAKLRAGFQNFTRTEREDLRRVALLQMHRQLHLLVGRANVPAPATVVQMSIALEALVIELYTEPAKTTPSVVRTMAHSIEILASLFEDSDGSQRKVMSRAKVLAVDDEVIARQLICSALEKARLEPVALDDPLAAHHLLEREHFGLIFLDIEMPGLTGLELCANIRATELNGSTPIVFVTSHSDFGSRAQSALRGGNDFIAKPFLLVEVALKALTWLFKDTAEPLGGANVQPSTSAKAACGRSTLAVQSRAVDAPRSSAAT